VGFEETEMGVLRERMEREMVLRRMAFRTRRSYAEAVAALAKHYRRSPDRLTQAEIQSYLLYLIEERKLARSSSSAATLPRTEVPGNQRGR
jgi:integrase/recombinase XerD